MDISSSLAASEYARARQATEATGNPSAGGPDFAAMAQDFTSTLQSAEGAAQDAMLGKVDPQILVEALAQSQLAVEAAVTIRDKVVEAYQEILRMPI